MGIEYRESGDLLEERGVDALVNTVNCKGVMGKGIALQFKEKFKDTDYFKDYRNACKEEKIAPGFVHVFDFGAKQSKAEQSKFDLMDDGVEMGSLRESWSERPRFIINFPTKNHWRTRSKMEYIRDGLADLVRVIEAKNIQSIALPALGCDNGGLNWWDVKDAIESWLGNLDAEGIRVVVFEPQGRGHQFRRSSGNRHRELQSFGSNRS